MVEDLDNYHLKELRCSTQCHTQKTLWIIARGHSGKTKIITAEKISVAIRGFWCIIPTTWDEMENEVFQDLQLIQKLRDDQKCMKKVEPSSRSKATEDIISIGSFVKVLGLNQYMFPRSRQSRRDLPRDNPLVSVDVLRNPDGSSCWTKTCQFTTPCSHFIFLIKDILIAEQELQNSFCYLIACYHDPEKCEHVGLKVTTSHWRQLLPYKDVTEDFTVG
ncbi:hypothetical protein Tco_1055191 [Tanacetum coccineum]|uniref:SWIM-type domain-containing protein n=1 Tax=Tanacetum coccineum TaxID=301880 RepID=A0ABQ5H021_9ASTR